MAVASSSSVPITTRSGRMKSPMAAPSRRNSGLEATLKWKARPTLSCSSRIQRRTRSAVPTGAVLLLTTTL
jgi:hypothetical protein